MPAKGGAHLRAAARLGAVVARVGRREQQLRLDAHGGLDARAHARVGDGVDEGAQPRAARRGQRALETAQRRERRAAPRAEVRARGAAAQVGRDEDKADAAAAAAAAARRLRLDGAFRAPRRPERAAQQRARRRRRVVLAADLAPWDILLPVLGAPLDRKHAASVPTATATAASKRREQLPRDRRVAWVGLPVGRPHRLRQPGVRQRAHLVGDLVVGDRAPHAAQHQQPRAARVRKLGAHRLLGVQPPAAREGAAAPRLHDDRAVPHRAQLPVALERARRHHPVLRTQRLQVKIVVQREPRRLRAGAHVGHSDEARVLDARLDEDAAKRACNVQRVAHHKLGLVHLLADAHQSHVPVVPLNAPRGRSARRRAPPALLEPLPHERRPLLEQLVVPVPQHGKLRARSCRAHSCSGRLGARRKCSEA